MQLIEGTTIGALTADDDDEILEMPDAWMLDDFADLLFWINRSARFPLNHGEEPYPNCSQKLSSDCSGCRRVLGQWG